MHSTLQLTVVFTNVASVVQTTKKFGLHFYTHALRPGSFRFKGTRAYIYYHYRRNIVADVVPAVPIDSNWANITTTYRVGHAIVPIYKKSG